MAINYNGNITLPAPEDVGADTSMERFDRMPPELRRFVANHPYRIFITPAGFERCKRIGAQAYVAFLNRLLPLTVKSSCREAYGPDHPQAQ